MPPSISVIVMLRPGSAGSFPRFSLRYVSTYTKRTTSNFAPISSAGISTSRRLSLQRPAKLALTLHKPFSTSLQRYASPVDKIDKKHEDVVGNEVIESHPDEVSSTSSVHQVFHEKGVPDEEKDEDMLAGVKADLVGHLWCRLI